MNIKSVLCLSVPCSIFFSLEMLKLFIIYAHNRKILQVLVQNPECAKSTRNWPILQYFLIVDWLYLLKLACYFSALWKIDGMAIRNIKFKIKHLKIRTYVYAKGHYIFGVLSQVILVSISNSRTFSCNFCYHVHMFK